MINHPLSNVELLEKLDEHVYGHTQAKKAIINVVNRSRLRWHQKYSHNVQEEDLLELHNLLLIGPSGTGKTHLVKTMAKLCDIPLLVFDATQLSPVGGKGDLDVQKMVKEIKNEVNAWSKNSKGIFTYDEIMSQLVVFIDEIDKLGIELHSNSNWNKEAQASLLKLVAGDDPEIQGITFIFAGAFTRVFDDVKSKKTTKKQGGIGFTFSKHADEENDIDWDDKIVEAGIITELAGRIHQVVSLDSLTLEDYSNIMYKVVLVKAAREFCVFSQSFSVDDSGDFISASFSLSKAQLDEIIKKSFESGQGVRMLNKKIFALLREIEFNYDSKRHTPKLDLLVKEKDKRFNEENF